MSQIPKKSLQFLKQLAANNNKLWFDAHRNDYDAAKADFVNFIADIIKGVSAFDNTITGLEAKKQYSELIAMCGFLKIKVPTSQT